MKRMVTAFIVLTTATLSHAAVFLNELSVNPPGSYDDTREFVELQGTPGMKLDGYGVAFVNGEAVKFHRLGTVPPWPANQEIDEFFSLDGLTLGPNGLLVLGIGLRSQYGQMLADSNFQQWSSRWNGGLDTPGKINNDGSLTVLLVRNRPGSTQAHPSGDVRWGKDVDADHELISPATRTFCNGGTRDGKHCECADDCPGGGVCEAADFCAGGSNDGDACAVAADCPGGSCVTQAIQTGDGSLDQGDVCIGGTNDGESCSSSADCPGGACQDLLDVRGSSTPDDLSDDLEVVDEVSWNDGNGWEYDLDDRHVDSGVCSGGVNDGQLCDRNCDCPAGACVAGSMDGLPRRRVHALGNPQNFNPDQLTRVDYRTKGPGWTPPPGAHGELPGGNNWQDTATEQWIRGESLEGSSGQGSGPWFFYDNGPNADADAIQPYMTNVPLWLNDGTGTDYVFTASSTYQLMAGRINPLALPFIPGDVDRDGDCDVDDIAKAVSVFGRDNWIFSNSYKSAPQGDSGDPAAQTRPWDVDATGDNGIDPSDLQWPLNFQGNTSGRIVGVRYDSTTPTPAGAGVYLNAAGTVACTVGTTLSLPLVTMPHSLKTGDILEITVSARVTAGAIATAGQQNGIMQFVHDLRLGTPGVLEVVSIQVLAPFGTTRVEVQSLQGNNGDAGVSAINGYTTSFTQGLSGSVDLYKITLRAKHTGVTTIDVQPSAEAKFAASTPGGIKVGHTNSNGNPATVVYPGPLSASVLLGHPFDCDNDSDVDGDDLLCFADCATGPAVPYDPNNLPAGCGYTPDDEGRIAPDIDRDGDVDVDDFAVYQRCYTGSGNGPAAPGCED